MGDPFGRHPVCDHSPHLQCSHLLHSGGATDAAGRATTYYAVVILLSLVLVFLSLTPAFALDEKLPEYVKRFGHPLYSSSDSAELRSDDIYYLSPLDRATLNLRNTADLFSGDIRFYYPDLVTPGREAALSPLGAGIRWTQLIWNDRRWRDAHTNRADLNLLPPMMIGSAESATGALSSNPVAPGVLRMKPVEVNSTRQALTSLHHREGFYGFGPVEFIHIRPLSETVQLTLGGYFPSSTGRFPPHSAYHGQTLWGRYHRSFASGASLAIMGMDGLHKVESPYQADRTVTHRSDFDLNYEGRILSQDSKLNLFRSETWYEIAPSRLYGREWGGGVTTGGRALRWNLFLVGRDGILEGGRHYDEKDISASLSASKELSRMTLRGTAGVEGRDFEQWTPVGILLAEYRTKGMSPYVKLSQSVDFHSPVERFGAGGSTSIEEPLEPMRAFYANLPVRGVKLDPTTLQGGEAGLKIKVPLGELRSSLFAWREENSAGWKPVGDTVLTWANIDARRAEGWFATYNTQYDVWRGSISAIVIQKHNSLQAYAVEPPFRLNWLIGRHKFFYDNAFETDFSLSGRYYSQFHSIAERPGEELGSGFPIDFRFTGKISRFTFHYALHNLNKSRYTLVPGYAMMHKEEYWGVEWLLID